MPIVNSGSFSLLFENQFPVYEEQIRCVIKEEEFNLSYNPTLQDISGSLLNFVTSSIFKPYITTLGLYNENEELLAVAKFAKPQPISSTTDMMFIIKLDK